jgi:hypothetical protein
VSAISISRINKDLRAMERNIVRCDNLTLAGSECEYKHIPISWVFMFI